jgi:hypothetical protein
LIDEIVELIPAEWLMADSPFTSAEEHRNAYATFLKTRILHSEIFVKTHNMQEQDLFEYAVIRVVPKVKGRNS